MHTGAVHKSVLSIAILFALVVSSCLCAQPVTILVDRTSPLAMFGVSEIQAALAARSHKSTISDPGKLVAVKSDLKLVLCNISDVQTLAAITPRDDNAVRNLLPEGFSIRAGKGICSIIGSDDAGVMYGALELAEMITVGGLAGITDSDQNPYMALRGTKFNCPLDARTPSYTDVCDAAQKNIAEMWNLDFWKEYIDRLARYRYNYISLWSLHPFPSLVKVPEYRDVALDDVKRSTVEWQEYYDGNGVGFDAPEILNNLETLKKMTIDDKIAFWRKVMAYGKDRNVDFYVVTWNIFTNGTYGKYGITDDIDNATTIDYFRKSVAQMFITYPDLAGIGLTTGENMPGSSFQRKEDWAFKTYGMGVLDAAGQCPGRKMKLIHRQHQTGATTIAETFKPLIDHKDIEFVFSFKYAKAHVYSSTTQPYHAGFVRDTGDLKTIWTLRNDDVYYFRWGAPDFVREFIKNIPYDVSRGFYLGSDQYVWGREFLSTEPETPRQIELAKHWYHWMIWGRLGYNPNVGSDRFAKVLQARYPEVDGQQLFTAFQEASMVYPLVTGFHWGLLDFQWYIESCRSRPDPAQTESGFHDVNRFITLAPHETAGNVSIPDYVDAVTERKQISGKTPTDLARELHAHADKALDIIDGLSSKGDKELHLTLGDIRAIAYMGKYYAHKIRGATALALFRKTGGQDSRSIAVSELNRAAHFWRLYVSTAMGQYTNPLWTNRVGHCDWRNLMLEVLDDIKIAGGQPQLASMSPTPGGTILQAQDARFNGASKAGIVAGHTGEGYLDFTGQNKNASVEWKARVPQAGTYILELRYIVGEGKFPCPIAINGKQAGEIIVWTSGGPSTWAWDRIPVTLEEGANTIRLSVNCTALVDCLNVLPASAL
jgi:hypothetical protein